MHAFRADVGDLGAGMAAIGQDARFCAGQRDRLTAERVHGHRGERDGGLFAGGEEHVEFALGGLRRGFAGELDQVVGHAGHGGNDGDDAAIVTLRFEQALRHFPDALRIADGGAAVFLHDQAHAALEM